MWLCQAKKCLQKKANQIKGKENNQHSKGNNQQSENATDTMGKKYINHMSKKGVNIQNIQGTYATEKKTTNNLILKWGKGLNRHFSRKTFSSVQFSHSVMSDSSQSQRVQHARLPCPSICPIAFSNSCPLSQ